MPVHPACDRRGYAHRVQLSRLRAADADRARHALRDQKRDAWRLLTEYLQSHDTLTVADVAPLMAEAGIPPDVAAQAYTAAVREGYMQIARSMPVKAKQAQYMSLIHGRGR